MRYTNVPARVQVKAFIHMEGENLMYELSQAKNGGDWLGISRESVLGKCMSGHFCRA